MYQLHNDKGWLRQYLPQPSNEQLYRFIEGVGKRVDHMPRPTPQQLENARMASYRALMGIAG